MALLRTCASDVPGRVDSCAFDLQFWRVGKISPQHLPLFEASGRARLQACNEYSWCVHANYFNTHNPTRSCSIAHLFNRNAYQSGSVTDCVHMQPFCRHMLPLLMRRMLCNLLRFSATKRQPFRPLTAASGPCLRGWRSPRPSRTPQTPAWGCLSL